MLSTDEVLILTNIPKDSAPGKSLLNELSGRFGIPLRRLIHSAESLKNLKLIDYDERSEIRVMKLTGIGEILYRIIEEGWSLPDFSLVPTNSGLKPLGAVVKEVKKNILQMVAEAGSGHVGASFSAVEILCTLYFLKMKKDPKNPNWVGRDCLILSKGHAAPALYAVLSMIGYFPEEELSKLRELGSILQGHPDLRTPGVDFVSGSLGQGLSVSIGFALAAKMEGSKRRIYVILGDGELDEGQVWEAALTASHLKLDNITAIIDRNRYQLSGETEKIKGLEPLADKWRAFGWEVFEAEGNSIKSISEALELSSLVEGKPSLIIAETTKGKGVSFIEGNFFTSRAPTNDELAKAIAELSYRMDAYDQSIPD